METVLSINLITSNPKVRGGRPCLIGTGIRVLDVVAATLFHDQKPVEIAAAYSVPISHVHAALAYYYEHKAEIDQDLREQIARAREFNEKHIGSRRDPLLPG
jgi:uncharacterized protein (DUF433 family)